MSGALRRQLVFERLSNGFSVVIPPGTTYQGMFAIQDVPEVFVFKTLEKALVFVGRWYKQLEITEREEAERRIGRASPVLPDSKKKEEDGD